MGMYNEVWCGCPECRTGFGYMQIPQVVLGFGNFDLDDPTTLEELEINEEERFYRYVREDNFICQRCENVFNPLRD